MENRLLAAARREGDRLRDAVAKVAEIAVPPASLEGLEVEESTEEIRALLLSRERRRELFCADLLKQVLSTRRAGAHWRRADWIGRFKPISDQAAALRAGIRRLGERDRVRSEVEKLIAIGGSGIDLKAFLGALDAVAEHGKALSAWQQRQTPHGRDAPRKLPFRPGASAADEFPVMLQTLAVLYGGKRLSLYRYRGKPAGKLLKALRLLGPHLGKGFEARWTYKVLRRLECVDLFPENSPQDGRTKS